mgnify:CR=1 FL=1
MALYQAGIIAFALAPGVVPAVRSPAADRSWRAAPSATLQATLVYLAAPIEMRPRIMGVLLGLHRHGANRLPVAGLLANRIGAPEATAVDRRAGAGAAARAAAVVANDLAAFSFSPGATESLALVLA